MKTKVSRSALIAAYAIAICADLIQMCLTPLFAEGVASPVDGPLDLVVCVLLSWLIGFHVAFLPSFFIKLVPLVEIAPTWTLAVLITSRHLRTKAVDGPAESEKPEVVPEEGKPPKLLPGKNE